MPKGCARAEYTNTPLLSLKDKNLVSFRDAPLSLTESPMSAPESSTVHLSYTPCNTLPVQWRPYNHPSIDPYSGTLKALIFHTPESLYDRLEYSHCYLQYHRQHGILPRLSRPCNTYTSPHYHHAKENIKTHKTYSNDKNNTCYQRFFNILTSHKSLRPVYIDPHNTIFSTRKEDNSGKPKFIALPFL